MKTKFDWKTSRAAFSTFKKLFFITLKKNFNLGEKKPSSITEHIKKSMSELEQFSLIQSQLSATWVSHVEIMDFSQANRSLVSEHLQAFADAGLLKIMFSGREKSYMINEKGLEKALKESDFESERLWVAFGIADTFNEFLKYYKQLKG